MLVLAAQVAVAAVMVDERPLVMTVVMAMRTLRCHAVSLPANQSLPPDQSRLAALGVWQEQLIEALEGTAAHPACLGPHAQSPRAEHPGYHQRTH